MSGPLIIAVPAKGRLQENAEEFIKSYVQKGRQ